MRNLVTFPIECCPTPPSSASPLVRCCPPCVSPRRDIVTFASPDGTEDLICVYAVLVSFIAAKESSLQFPATSEVKQAVHRSSLPLNISCLLAYSFLLQDASAGNIPTHLATSRSDVSQPGIPSVPPDSRDGGPGSPDAACRFC